MFHVITACDAYGEWGWRGREKNNNVTVIPLYLLSAMLSNSADEELCEHGGAALPALHIRCLPEDCRRSSGRQRARSSALLCSAPLCVTQVLVSAGCDPAGGVREQEEDGGRGGGAGSRQRRKRKKRGREMNRKWRRRRRRPAVSGSRPALPEEAPCCSGPSKRSPHAPNQRLRGSGSPGLRGPGGAPLPRMASAGT